jgi:hypothetical protein
LVTSVFWYYYNKALGVLSPIGYINGVYVMTFSSFGVTITSVLFSFSGFVFIASLATS